MQPYGAVLAGVVQGTLEPSLRSEEPPANDLDGHVRVVVGKTFDQMVKDPEKDVFLEVRGCLGPVYRQPR